MNFDRNKFVFAKKNIDAADNAIVEKNDVGVIESESTKDASAFFIRIWQKIRLNENDFEIFDVKKTGDGFHKKICNICHKLLDTTKFARNQNGKNNRPVRRPSCSDCRKQLEGINIPHKTKIDWLEKKPQGKPFECPICKKRTIAGVTSKVVLDHNHRNGEVRGWICDSCNTGIGRFKDNVNLIKRAIGFLK